MSQKDLYNKPGYVLFMVTLVLNLVFMLWISFGHEGIQPNPGENLYKESK